MEEWRKRSKRGESVYVLTAIKWCNDVILGNYYQEKPSGGLLGKK